MGQDSRPLLLFQPPISLVPLPISPLPLRLYLVVAWHFAPRAMDESPYNRIYLLHEHLVEELRSHSRRAN